MIDLKKSSRQVAVLVLITSLFFSGSFLVDRDFRVEDEARYAGVLREMVVNNQWIVPHLNGRYYPDKPPIYFWLAALFSFLTGGITPLSFLLINWLSALGLVLTTYYFGRYLFDSLGGFIAALILAGSLLFVVSAQVVRMDMLFSFFITLAVFCFYRGFREGKGSYYLSCYFFSALAVLTKGPFGFIFVFLPAAVFLILKKTTKPGQDFYNKSFCGGSRAPHAWGSVYEQPSSIRGKNKIPTRPKSLIDNGSILIDSSFAAGGSFLKNPGLLLFIALVFGWLFLAAVTGHEDFVENIFNKQVIGRALDSFQHKEPFYYYLLALPPVFLPWFPFLPRVVKQVYLRRREEPFLLLLLWFISGFLVISAVSCKLFIYLLPLLPPLALLSGNFFSGQMRNCDARGKYFLIEGIAAVFFTFGAFLIVPTAAGYFSFPFTILFSGFLLAGIVFLCLKKWVISPALKPLVVLMPGMVIFSLTAALVFTPLLNNHFSPKPIGEKIRHYTAAGFRAATFRVTRGIFNFYAGQQIEELSRKDIPFFLNSPGRNILIIKARALKKIEKKFPYLQTQGTILHSGRLNNEQYLFLTLTGVSPEKEKGGAGQ